MAWLTGWAKRRKITVSHANIDADLTHFPLLVTLGTTAGTGATDVSSIFDEVGANSQKIAVTKADEETQLYVEIEKWDNTNEVALLWVSKSDWVVDGDADTDLYIYYDSTQDDNTTYIGITPDDTPSNNVWDSNFLAVFHMNQSSGTLKDSTSNNRDGTFAGNLPDVARAGVIGSAQDLDGTGDYISVSIPASANITRECLFYADSLANHQGLLSRGGSAWEDNVCHIKAEGNNAITFDINIGGSSTKRTWGSLSASAWYYLTCTYNSTTGLQALYGNGASRDSATVTTGKTPAQVDYIGNEYDGARDADGVFDEVRFSNTDRPLAYHKANHYNFTDDLVAWYVEETGGTATNDSRNAKITGKQSTTSNRSAKLTGKETLSIDYFNVAFVSQENDSRDAKITGKNTANDNRSAKVIGTATANDSRSATILGKDSANSARNAKISGKATAYNARTAVITGKEVSNADRNAHLIGKNTSDSSRSAKIIGNATADDNRSAKISGKIATENNRNAKIVGKDTSNDYRASKVIGKDTFNDTRSAKIHGNATANDLRSAKIIGRDTSDTSRGAVITGIDTDNDYRNAKIIGQATADSSRSAKLTGEPAGVLVDDARSAKITGKAGANDYRNAKLTGKATSNDYRLAKVVGNATLEDTRQAVITGVDTDNSSRNAHIVGKVNTLDDRTAVITGKDTGTDNRIAKITGYDTAQDTRSAKLHGTATGQDNRNATITGKDTANSNRNARITGNQSTSSSRGALIVGKGIWYQEDPKPFKTRVDETFATKDTDGWYNRDNKTIGEKQDEKWYKHLDV